MVVIRWRPRSVGALRLHRITLLFGGLTRRVRAVNSASLAPEIGFNAEGQQLVSSHAQRLSFA